MGTVPQQVMLDGSLLIIESLARAGADTFIGYPITPANLLYSYGSRRFPVSLAAPDEITTLQWMAGFSAAGKIPVTATSFPGLALMVESINMAYMMELPMVIVMAQRLGPATGTATMGAQGDILLLNGLISGGYPLPTLCISSIDDCWSLAAESVKWAVEMRTPVILLTSKEDVMTKRNFDLNSLPEIHPVSHRFQPEGDTFRSYMPNEKLVPPFLPVGNSRHQVRINASTHDTSGILQNNTPEALGNTRRLEKKMVKNLPDFTHYEYLESPGASDIILTYGVTAQASREAVERLKNLGQPASLLVAKTIFPIPDDYLRIIEKYKRVIVPEENLRGQFRQILFGTKEKNHICGINTIGRMITPGEIVQEVMGNDSGIR